MIKQIDIAGSKIFYRVYGKGKPVVLIHGFGETGEVWEKQIAFLEKDFQLIVPDLPGSGQSEIIDDMSMEGMAEVIKKILDVSGSVHREAPPSVGFGEAVLIGHSMGGYITLAFAEKYPVYLSAFGLFHSTAYADSEEKKETRKKGIEFVRKYGAFEFLKTSIPNLFSPLTKTENPGLITRFIDRLKDFSEASVALYYKAMMQRPDRTRLLQSTSLPILFILGKYDMAVPFNDSLKLAHMPEIVYIHILSRSGHMGMLEEDEKCNDILKKFLSEN